MGELTIARPHEGRRRGYTTVEWPIYCEGYYHALQMALTVMPHAADRWALRRRTRRLEAKSAREKAGAA